MTFVVIGALRVKHYDLNWLTNLDKNKNNCVALLGWGIDCIMF